MCLDPASLAAMQFAVMAAGTAVSTAQGFAQYSAQKDAAERNADNATEAAVNQYGQINRRQIQEDAAAFQKKQEVQREGRMARSTAQVAAGEAGVAGPSLDRVYADYYFREGQYTAAVDTNNMWTDRYLQGEKASARTGAQNQINAMPQPEAPNLLEPVIRLFGAGLTSYDSYLRYQKLQTTSTA